MQTVQVESVGVQFELLLFGGELWRHRVGAGEGHSLWEAPWSKENSESLRRQAYLLWSPPSTPEPQSVYPRPLDQVQSSQAPYS